MRHFASPCMLKKINNYLSNDEEIATTLVSPGFTASMMVQFTGVKMNAREGTVQIAVEAKVLSPGNCIMVCDTYMYSNFGRRLDQARLWTDKLLWRALPMIW